MTMIEHTALQRGAVIGILGGGQLARMLAMAALRLGFGVHVYAPGRENPAFEAAAATSAAYDDDAALRAFAAHADVVTYEFENVPDRAVRIIADQCAVQPRPQALAIAQDRLLEKRFLAQQGCPIAEYAAVDTGDDLRAATKHLGYPLILKARREGYDGKAQWRLGADVDIEPALEQLNGRPAVVERVVDFAMEVSVIAVRSLAGEFTCYDVVHNIHENHILRRSIVPAALGETFERAVTMAARDIATALDYVGVLAVEMFVVGEVGAERFIINEIAPRVHNSGHWTLDACPASQFENHIRAIAGLGLGDTNRQADVRMENLLGDEIVQKRAVYLSRGAVWHDYGKRTVRAGRKMGHATFLSVPAASCDDTLWTAP